MKVLNTIPLYLLALLLGCASQQKTTAVQSSKYSEDLSMLRPAVAIPTNESKPAEAATPTKSTYVEAKNTINKPLNTVLDSIARINISRKFIDGFTIQLYSGLDREQALASRKELTIALPDIESEIQYSQPNFRVKAGKYFSRLDAQKDFLSVRQHFPSAIVVPDKIAIN